MLNFHCITCVNIVLNHLLNFSEQCTLGKIKSYVVQCKLFYINDLTKYIVCLCIPFYTKTEKKLNDLYQCKKIKKNLATILSLNLFPIKSLSIRLRFYKFYIITINSKLLKPRPNNLHGPIIYLTLLCSLSEMLWDHPFKPSIHLRTFIIVILKTIPLFIYIETRDKCQLKSASFNHIG